MPISRVKWASLSLILFVSAFLAPHVESGVAAQPTPNVDVASSTAHSDFPEDISFALAASVDQDVVAVDLVYQQARIETLQLLPATFQQSADALSAAAVADFTINFVPAGIDLTYHWVITFTNETVIETDSAVVTWIDDRFEWDRTVGVGVEIYSYDRSEQFLQFVVETANAAVQDLVALYVPPDQLPIRIWLYDSERDFAGTLAPNSQEWAAGAAYPSLQIILAVIPDDNQSEVGRVIPHEISHQLLYQATLNPFNAPAAWIDEGLAVSAQTGGKNHYQRIARDAHADGDLLSLRGLISSFPFDPSEATLAYAQSYLVVEFIRAQYGDDAIQRIIAAYREGTDHDDVVRAALGTTIDELDQAWRAQLDDASMPAAA